MKDPKFGTSSGLKDRLDLKMAAILKISKYFRQVYFGIRYGKIVRISEIMPEKLILMLMTSLMTSLRDVKVDLLYSCLNEIVTFSAI